MAARADNFNRTASPPGTPSDGGSAWSVVSGSWETDGTSLRLSADGDSTIFLECGSADGEVQAVWTNSVGGPCLALRVVDDNNKILFSVDAFTGAQFYSRVAGGYTAIGTSTGAFAANGSTVKVAMSGTSLAAYVGATQVATATCSDHLTATKHGLRATSTSAEFDDFSFTGSGGGATIAPIYWYYSRMRGA